MLIVNKSMILTKKIFSPEIIIDSQKLVKIIQEVPVYPSGMDKNKME